MNRPPLKLTNEQASNLLEKYRKTHDREKQIAIIKGALGLTGLRKAPTSINGCLTVARASDESIAAVLGRFMGDTVEIIQKRVGADV